MSGPEEVERLVQIVADGVRRKMLRPENLSKYSWIHDSDADLIDRVGDEVTELTHAIRETERYMRQADIQHIQLPANQQKFLYPIADECYDLAAFGAMLEDSRRTGLRPRKVA